MTHVFYRDIRAKPPVAVRSEGIHIIDEAGKRYIDASGGAAVSVMGHSDPDVRQAIVGQVESLAYAHTAFFTTRAQEELADLLVDASPAGLDHVYFVSGGSEAMDTALKLARQYFVDIGEPQRRHFVARRQSYHGNTLGALAIGGNALRRAPYEPLLIEATHISPCYAYRGRSNDESEEDYGLRVANELKSAIQELGPETVIGFVAETVVGSSIGAATAVPGYFKRVREICDRYGVLLILDEVMSGMGRTGSLFASEQEGITPDLVIVAKGLGAGYQPIGAVLASDSVYRGISDGSGYFQHGHTYMGHATACAAALAVQRAIIERDLLDNVRRQGEGLDRALHDCFGNHPYVGEIRGRGLFRALELVADRSTKEPFDPDLGLNVQIKNGAFERGLICYPSSGTADGLRGDHVLLAPPFIVNDKDIREIVGRLDDAIADVFSNLDAMPIAQAAGASQ